MIIISISYGLQRYSDRVMILIYLMAYTSISDRVIILVYLLAYTSISDRVIILVYLMSLRVGKILENPRSEAKTNTSTAATVCMQPRIKVLTAFLTEWLLGTTKALSALWVIRGINWLHGVRLKGTWGEEAICT